MRRSVALLLLLSAVAGCDKASTPPPAEGAALALAPADPKLAKLYAQTCKSCHTSAASGAPMAGDKAAWAPRVAQGLPTLVQHAVEGYKGMPPMGSCSDCTEKELTALITFMSGAPAP